MRLPWLGASVALALAVGVVRSDVLWNGGRSVPLLNWWRAKGFERRQMEQIDLTGKVTKGAGWDGLFEW
jgi:hypothetical protein